MERFTTTQRNVTKSKLTYFKELEVVYNNCRAKKPPQIHAKLNTTDFPLYLLNKWFSDVHLLDFSLVLIQGTMPWSLSGFAWNTLYTRLFSCERLVCPIVSG